MLQAPVGETGGIDRTRMGWHLGILTAEPSAADDDMAFTETVDYRSVC